MPDRVEGALRNNPPYNVPMHIGQAVLTALVAESELRVVNAAEMQNRGLHVVDVNGIGGNVPSEVVRRTIHRTGRHTTPGEEPTVSLAEMIAPRRFGGISLAEWCAAEFARPDHERVREHAPFFQVLDQRRCRTFGVATLYFELRV